MHVSPRPSTSDWSKPKSKGLSEEMLAGDIPVQPMVAQQEVCSKSSACTPQQLIYQHSCGVGLNGLQLNGPPPPCLVAIDQKQTDENESYSEHSSPPVHTSDSGLESDLAPLTYSPGHYPVGYVCCTTDSETRAEHVVVSQGDIEPLEDTSMNAFPQNGDLCKDVEFLQDMTHLDTAFLMSLYMKCSFDLERTVDVALTCGNSDSDRCSSTSDIYLESGTDLSHSISSVLDSGVDKENEGSVVTDGGDISISSEDTNLTRLSKSFSTQLQNCFGKIDESLLSGGRLLWVCTLYAILQM